MEGRGREGDFHFERRRLKSHARVRERRQVNTKGEGAKEGETRSHDQLNAKEGAG